jgi:hypothetical protein
LPVLIFKNQTIERGKQPTANNKQPTEKLAEQVDIAFQDLVVIVVVFVLEHEEVHAVGE